MSDGLRARVIAGFRADFPDAPEPTLVRSPGRVNIIGEHTDYNGLPVLPAALDRKTMIALAPCAASEVILTSIERGYGERRFEISGDIEHYPAGDWGNYAKAAAQALWNSSAEQSPSSLPLKGFRGCVGGTIPAAAGLSSSSALVVAVGVALVEANRLDITRPELAALLASAERYVGTEGGGMDQTACLLTRPGEALKIDFNPLRVRPVPLPSDSVLVVANSMVHADKSGSARLAYNTRVAECRLGVRMLARLAGMEEPRLLSDIYGSTANWRELLSELPDGPLSIADVAAVSGHTQDWLTERCLTRPDGALLTDPETSYEVKKRCTHVFTEAERVELAAAVMPLGDSPELGRLMNESHSSCADHYEISCVELDQLVGAFRQHGALGSRLTGAGFGGCTVSLVRRTDVDAVLDGVWRDYYLGFLPERGIAPPRRSTSLFSFTPSGGAGVIT